VTLLGRGQGGLQQPMRPGDCCRHGSMWSSFGTSAPCAGTTLLCTASPLTVQGAMSSLALMTTLSRWVIAWRMGAILNTITCWWIIISIMLLVSYLGHNSSECVPFTHGRRLAGTHTEACMSACLSRQLAAQMGFPAYESILDMFDAWPV